MNNQELKQIYDELQAELDLLSVELDCKACGDCCDFRVFEHIPYVTNIELKFIRAELKKNSEGCKDAACCVSTESQDLKLCPFYRDKKCIAHQLRPLSCRVYFCNQEYEKKFSSQIYEKYHQKIKELHKNNNVEYLYCRLVKELQQIITELTKK